MKKRNIWKWLFWILLSGNILLFFMFMIIFSGNHGQNKYSPSIEITRKDKAELVVKTDKEDLNGIIHHYLEKKQKSGPIRYTILLTEKVEFYGEIEVFSKKFQLQMIFQPKVLDNGDILLKQQSLSLGGVKLPVQFILSFIRDYYELPNWVYIHPDEKQIYVALQEMELENGAQIKVNELDLQSNNIELTMFIPVK